MCVLAAMTQATGDTRWGGKGWLTWVMEGRRMFYSGFDWWGILVWNMISRHCESSLTRTGGGRGSGDRWPRDGWTGKRPVQPDGESGMASVTVWLIHRKKAGSCTARCSNTPLFKLWIETRKRFERGNAMLSILLWYHESNSGPNHWYTKFWIRNKIILFR